MKNFIRKTLAFLTAAVITVTAAVIPASAADTKIKPGKNEAMTYVDSMGAGWNLGNAFDAVDKPEYTKSDEMQYETIWCGAKTTKELIKTVKKAGFKTIRLPVTWLNHVDKDFKISDKWMARYKEVVDWCVEEGLYIIIDLHHDVYKGYYYPDKQNYETSKKYVKTIWKQVAETFKDYGEKVMFEVINEPRLTGTDYEWWYQQNPVPQEVQESLEIINELNQLMLDTIRETGGKNAKRYVLVGGYDTDGTEKGILSPYFKMPKDSVKNRLIAAVHFYGVGERDGHRTLDGLYTNFTSKGIPVVITEYGLNSGGYKYLDNTEAAVKRMTDFGSYARERGISVVFWDNNYIRKGEKGHKLIDRATAKVICPEITKAFTTANKPAGLADSGKISVKATASKNSVKLSWDKVKGATKYAVYVNKGSKYECVSSKVTSNSYTVKSLKAGTKYKFYVRAFVNGKWTKVSQSKVTSVKTKSS